MTPEQIKKLQQDWYNENAPLGRELGYPECCIKAFCDQPPEVLNQCKLTDYDRRRYKAGCINGVFTGFIPCTHHANEILSGRITVYSLIKNRNPKFLPFPHFK